MIAHLIRQTQSADPRLGRHINHDPRSLLYPYRGPQRIIVSVRHNRIIPILDQGQVGSCTGNAAEGALGTEPFYDIIEQLTITSKYLTWNESGAVAIYTDATRIDNFPGDYPDQDTGSDGVSVAKVLQKAGIIPGYEHTFSMDQFLQALMTVPVIIGIDWMSDMYNPSKEGVVSISGSYQGGHEIVSDEYDAARGLVGLSNSWGPQWGLEGRFYLQAEDLATLLSRGGDATVFTVPTEPAPQPEIDPDTKLRLAADKFLAKRHYCPSTKEIATALTTWEQEKSDA